MAPHSSTLAWKIPWTEEPGRLQSMGSLRVGHDWATSLSLFTFMHWRRKWQPTPVFLPGESQGRGILMGCRLWGRTELDTTEATQQQGHVCSRLRRQLLPHSALYFPFQAQLFVLPGASNHLVLLPACLSIWGSLILLRSLCSLCFLPGFHRHHTRYQCHRPETVSLRLSDWCLQNGQCPVSGHRLLLGPSFIIILEMHFLFLLCLFPIFSVSLYFSLQLCFGRAHPSIAFKKKSTRGKSFAFLKITLVGYSALVHFFLL